MKIGVLKEIKDKENRVALTPEGAKALVQAGHDVLMQKGAGEGSGFADQEYGGTGAQIVTADRAWACELVLKVKEPLESEYGYLQEQILFTYLHLAATPKRLVEVLLDRKTTEWPTRPWRMTGGGFRSSRR